MKNDNYYMEQALFEAEKAIKEKEVPIGAVVVYKGKIIGRGYNRIERLQDATAHAEIIAITSASATLGTWRMNECELYVTIEPCMMCCGSILLSRFKRVVYGAKDPRFGACVSQYNLLENNKYNHKIEVVSGVLEKQCSSIIKLFFKEIRYK